MAGSLWERTLRDRHGSDYARAYAAHFDELAAAGTDVHGEVAFLRPLLGAGARVLDAGCGTGRVAQRLAAEGYAVTGVDADPAMIEIARERAPEVTWVVSDLCDLALEQDLDPALDPDLDLDLGTFDLVVMAGNVVPFVEGDLTAVCSRLAAHLGPRGLLVCGYGLDRDHLPEGALEVPFATYAAACEAAGLHLVGHHAGWEGQGYDGGGYSVSVHARPDPDERAPA